MAILHNEGRLGETTCPRSDRLKLESTESVLLRDTTGTLKALHQLRAMGICVALNDFGTGYSSLSYLRSFPFSKIKIDQSFVRDMMTSKECISVIRAVTGLGQSLGIKTVAEGVETQQQVDGPREEACTEVQGYFLGRPQPAGAVPALIKRLQQIGRKRDPVCRTTGKRESLRLRGRDVGSRVALRWLPDWVGPQRSVIVADSGGTATWCQ